MSLGHFVVNVFMLHEVKEKDVSKELVSGAQ
jgi:hypothetical protein